MSPLDALFLHIEDGISHMHIGSCAVFDGPAPTFDALVGLICSKLDLATRYRQKVRFVPAGLGHPVWVDDPHFDPTNHMVHVALPPPGGKVELEELVGRIMSHELDRHRPLWEISMVEGLSDDRWALICKVHHCMADGIAGTDLIAILLDVDADVGIRSTRPWNPEPEPSDALLATNALLDATLRPVRRVLSWRTSGPRQVWSGLRDTSAGLLSFARVIGPNRRLSLEGRIGPRRRWSTAVCALDDIKAIRRAFGGSCNDVILSVIAGAFRQILIERGDPLDENVVLRALVPVSTRRDGDHKLNNQVSLLIAELPVGIADPVERLEAVRTQMSSLKASHQISVGAAVVAGAELIPPFLLPWGTRIAAKLLRRYPQRTINTVTTNVPGPQFPLYALGREMLEYLPYVPLSQGVRFGVAIISYNGSMSIGITGDYDYAPDVGVMCERVVAEVAALSVCRASGSSPDPPQAPPASRKTGPSISNGSSKTRRTDIPSRVRLE